jgi:hypothetical protein
MHTYTNTHTHTHTHTLYFIYLTVTPSMGKFIQGPFVSLILYLVINVSNNFSCYNPLAVWHVLRFNGEDSPVSHNSAKSGIIIMVLKRYKAECFKIPKALSIPLVHKWLLIIKLFEIFRSGKFPYEICNSTLLI